jgi:hypothetical protein
LISVNEHAVLLDADGAASSHAKLSRLAAFFGVTVAPGPAADLAGDAGAGPARRLLGSARAFASWLRQPGNGAATFWQQRVHSVFVHAGAPEEQAALTEILLLLAPASGLQVVRAAGTDTWQVASGPADLVGPMRGIRLARGSHDPAWTIAMPTPTSEAHPLITTGQQTVFLRLQHHGVPVLISTAGVIDLAGAVSERGFDVREAWAESVPAAMYFRWAFAKSCWRPRDYSACLIIDDPLLRPRYGFVQFAPLLEEMRRHRFSTSIAFIPWNFRRSRGRVARLFRENPQHLSLSVHGCDHTGAEFGSGEVGRLRQKLTTASARMDRHATATGIQHDRVMVFPQGVFSTAAMAALKCGGYVGVVNTDVTSVDAPPQPVRVADVWDMAVMTYGSFPLYTRRYPWQGPENFAFDALLGKPCLVVIHHDACRGENRPLVKFIDGLNAQLPDLQWRSLGEVLRRGYRWRALASGRHEIEMYAGELLLENPTDNVLHFQLRRRDVDATGVERILAGDVALPFTQEAGYVRAELSLQAHETCLVRVVFRASPAAPIRPDSLKYRVKTAARRYLSEFRDNYVARMKPAPHEPGQGFVGGE